MTVRTYQLERKKQDIIKRIEVLKKMIEEIDKEMIIVHEKRKATQIRFNHKIRDKLNST